MTDTNKFGWPVVDWTPPPLPQHDVIEGQYARLEPLSVKKHASALWDAFSEDREGKVWDYLPDGPFVSLSQFYKKMQDLEPSKDPMFFVIRDIATGRPGGFLSFLRMTPEVGSIEVGYITFAPMLQGTKTGAEAVILMARKAFELGYRRFEWKCNALNLRSRRAAERYGFSYEGVFRQAAIVKGRNRDTAWFAMVDSEFEKLNKAYELWLEPRNFISTGTEIKSLRNLTAPVLVTKDPKSL